MLGAPMSCAGEDPTWPSFVPPRETVPDAARVERIWTAATFRRTITPPPVEVPFALYGALIDAPDVVAAAARRLGVGTETVVPSADGAWEVRSTKGSRALYRVLVSASDRRVVLSYGHVMVLGLAIPGSVLGVLDLDDRTTSVGQRLTVYARVEHAAWALVAKFLLAILPSLADAELARGFRITAAVATWARDDRAEFCAWLRSAGFSASPVTPAVGCSVSAG